MQKEIKKIKTLLNSKNRLNQKLALAIVKGWAIDLRADLPEYYETYVFLEKYAEIEKGLNKPSQVIQQLLDLECLQLMGQSIDFIPNLSLPNLRRLEVVYNQIFYPIPNFTNLPQLVELCWMGNHQRGYIPNFTHLPELEELNLSVNKLTGSIPNFSNLPKLQLLDLQDNQLIGSIPDFSNLPNLTSLDLGKNQLNKAVPNFSKLPKLYALFLGKNNLEGKVPDFSNLPNLQIFCFVGNQLHEFPEALRKRLNHFDY
ncbi:MAG: leucine-rich repeat domain-containing protein [Saprospiraceae bacterium]|nr:leucine-rich repeat domain-containing protein [Saprospiraceae bacterium]